MATVLQMPDKSLTPDAFMAKRKATASEDRSYASTQVNLAKPVSDAVIAFGRTIPTSALAEHGRETEPHITVLYGLHDDEPDDAMAALKGEGPITAKLGKASIFDVKGKYDVLKIDVDSPELHKLNAKLAKLPHTNTHPDYTPHVTIAYLKPGMGARYAGRVIPGVTGKSVTFGTVKYSPAEGEKSDIPLVKEPNGIRRVTGSADISLTPEGKKQAKEQADDTAEPYDKVFTSPEKRAMQTAEEFGKPTVLEGLGAWRRGSLEGQPVERVKGAIRFLMLHPDKRPSGISPISKERGDTLNEFAKPLLATIQALDATRPKDERWLVISHGGNLQAVNAWGESGFPEDLSFDFKKMALKPYWSVVGDLFRIGTRGLDKAKDNKDPGLYLVEHSETAYNPSSDKGTKSK